MEVERAILVYEETYLDVPAMPDLPRLFGEARLIPKLMYMDVDDLLGDLFCDIPMFVCMYIKRAK